MLADLDTSPRTLPPGFGYVDGEEEFDEGRHLALEIPEQAFALAELGYSDEAGAHFPLTDRRKAITRASCATLPPRAS